MMANMHSFCLKGIITVNVIIKIPIQNDLKGHNFHMLSTEHLVQIWVYLDLH